MDSNTVTLIVAGLGITGTLLAHPLNAWLIRRDEHRKWSRDRRLTVYLDFITKATDTVNHRLQNPPLVPDHEQVGRVAIVTEKGLRKMEEEIKRLDVHSDNWLAFALAYRELLLFSGRRVRHAASLLNDAVSAINEMPAALSEERLREFRRIHNKEFLRCLLDFQEAVRVEMGLGKF